MSDKIMSADEFKEGYAKERGYNGWIHLRHELWINKFYIAESECMQAHAEYYHREMVKEMKNDDKFVFNVCLSYRHDYGMLNDSQQEVTRFSCKEWMRAIENNLTNTNQ